MTRHANPGIDAKRDTPTGITARQRLVIFLLLGTGFMLSVDFSILNVALPEVGAAVGLDLATLPWVATAYALPAAGFTLLFGRIADLFGRRRMWRPSSAASPPTPRCC
jgi:MFS family permease